MQFADGRGWDWGWVRGQKIGRQESQVHYKSFIDSILSAEACCNCREICSVLEKLELTAFIDRLEGGLDSEVRLGNKTEKKCLRTQKNSPTSQKMLSAVGDGDKK
jgi:hypothetical protein